MKRTYIKPATAVEAVELAQIIAASPSLGETPAINDDPSEGGAGLVKDSDFGDLW